MQLKTARLSLSRFRAADPQDGASKGTLARARSQPLVPAGRSLPGKSRQRETRAPAKTKSDGSFYKTFVIFVLIPTIVAFLYIAFVQTRQYVAESRFVIRAATEPKSSSVTDAISILSKLGGSGASKSTAQDGFIVTDYIRGRTVVDDLGGKDFVANLFAKPSIDYASRLSDTASKEEMWKYWIQHVNATLDTISGVVTLRVRAFSAQDALTINEKILKLSESLINTISERSRNDAVRRAEKEIETASVKLIAAKTKLLEFRNRNVLIDPVVKAASIGDLIGKLTIKRIEVENNFSSLAGSLSADSPSQRLLATQLSVIDRQIEELKGQLTGSSDNPRVSAEIGEFEQLKLSEIFAQRIYQIAQASYEKARQEAAKQQLFLVTIVKPLLPEEPLVPQVGIDTFLFFASALIFWSIGSLLLASVKDHMD